MTVPVRLRYVQEFKDRHSQVRRYFRRPGSPRIPLPGRPGSPEFMAAYNAAISGITVEPAKPVARSAPGSVSATVAAYYTDASFLALADGTQRARRPILERFREVAGEHPIANMRQDHVAMALSRMRPYAQRNWLKALRGLMQFAKRIGLRPDDPTQGVELVRAPKSDGHHTWSEDEIAQFEAAHPIGSRARLAMGLLLYTAARRGDMVRLGPQHLRDDRLSYRQQKTGRSLSIPVHPALAEILAASPSGHLTFLTTPGGTPYTGEGFGKLFRRWCIEAGLRNCTPHGLRKAQARRLAEAGCSAHEIAAITGHRTLSEVQRYADAADQARLAEMAFGRTRREPVLSNRPNRSVKPA